MSIFKREPSRQEVKAFGRGRQTSAKAAQQYAAEQRRKAAIREAQKERRAADKRRGVR